MTSSKPDRARDLQFHEAPAPTHDDIVRICGDILDWKIAAIEGTGATLAELEEARAWIAGESDVMAEARKRLAGRVAEVCDILTADEQPDEDAEAQPALG